MIRQRRHPAATQGTVRLEAFTDGVFAIAATLLVLDLTAHSFGQIGSDAQMWAALGSTGPLFVNFAVSFVLLCRLWMLHVDQFEHIARVDATMVWLNNIRLLFIVLVPFATNLTTEHPGTFAGRLSMPVAFFFAILCSALQWAWAMRHRDVMLPDLEPRAASAYGRGCLSALIIGGVVVIVAPWAGSFAFLLFFFDGLLTRALRGRST